jgi:hypothetical protein
MLKLVEQVTGESTPQLRIKYRCQHHAQQLLQPPQEWWKSHQGEFVLPPQWAAPKRYRNHICLQDLTLHHPAVDILLKYAMHGCPALTGQLWAKAQMQVAIYCGPHILAMVDKPMI